VSRVSVDIAQGETLGIVGESGCGKSTLARASIQLPPPTSGTVLFEGQDLTQLKGEALRRIRPRMQMIFQDPISSLNPRRKVGDLVGEGLQIWGIGDKASKAKKVDEVLDAVGIDPDAARDRRPHEFSGGQCQRISIARAVVTEPKLIICDEPVSALDVSVQAQIINLLDDLQDDFKLTYLFVAHDLSVVRHVSDRIAVMYLGKLMEVSPAEELYTKSIHPYTSALLAAIPIPDPRENRSRERIVVGGEPPNPINPPSGCVFHPRCPRATDVCRQVEPPLVRYANGHLAACHHPLSVSPEEIGAATRDPSSPVSAGDQMPAAPQTGGDPVQG
jgi:oligopeptide/dipeptide ABC transporter ATP-binding protein